MAIKPEITDSSGTGDDPQLRLPQRNVLADDVYQILKDSLLSHRIRPGSRLNLDRVARELHVSNTPVRQALARLESDGLVTKEPYRGFTASALLDSRSILELYEYRLLIEPPTAARAARRRSAEDLAGLESLCDIDDIRRLVADTSTRSEIARRDTDFHCGIAQQAGNSVVVEHLTATLTRMSRFTLYDRYKAAEQAWQEHREITAAIAAADPDAAAAAMRTHLLTSLDRMRKVFG